MDSGVDFAALLKKDEESGSKENPIANMKTSDVKSKDLLKVKEIGGYLSQSYEPSRMLLDNSVYESEDQQSLMDSDVRVELKKSRLTKSLHSLSGRNIGRNTRAADSQISIVKSIDSLAHGIGSTLSLDDHITVSCLFFSL